MTNNYLKKYYGSSGEYLTDHRLFLDSANLEKDTDFLVKALSLKQDDKILDIACGQGRHTNYLAQRGYHVDGTDFSEHLIKKAKESAVGLKGEKSEYFISDIMSLKLSKKYNKAYWFFSDLANIDIPTAINSISNNIEIGGMVLFDTDNIFRIISYLLKNPDSNYKFDATEFKLIDDKKKLDIPYPPLPIWEQWMEKSKFSIQKVIGDYDFREYSIYSPRLILIVKKIA
ncbi:MAG: class I SAM-dependent methyltransferase [Patescibacteria group bacterium]